MSRSKGSDDRIVIENVQPEIDGGSFPVKRAVGEKVAVRADIFADGHDTVSARLLFREAEEKAWHPVSMRFMENDRWEGEFVVRKLGRYVFTVEGWVDPFRTWRHDLQKKTDAKQDIHVELLIGAALVDDAAKRASGEEAGSLSRIAEALRQQKDPARTTSLALGEELAAMMEKAFDDRLATRYHRELEVVVEPRRALFSSWYERFPRSCAASPGKHGTFGDLEKILPEIARMGFDVLYLPPIHPIGKAHRKGKNNAPTAGPEEPGSPWAIGSEEGGHTAVHPDLGTLKDFERLVRSAGKLGIHVAIDLAFQCSPDHPYVKEHPQWFRWRPDGTVQFAENPPKKYEDVLPLNFDTDDREELHEELKRVVEFWIKRGVLIFRVDNPHTKPLAFWEWLISGIKERHPEVIFLAEAFTRPKVMYRLAKAGFSQSYTYFTWRTSKQELMTYLTELTATEVGEIFRPNFWPNTPDILPEHLQYGGRPAFLTRLVLAATLSSNYGIYGPVFELCLQEARAGTGEYIDSEKYEIKHWDWDQPGNLKDFIARVNRIRRENPALQTTRNLKFYELNNDSLIAYEKASEDGGNIILVVVNLDPYHTQSGWLRVPLHELGIDPTQPYHVHDLLSDDKYIWNGEWNYVELNPQIVPAHILAIRKRLKRETDFDYFM